jgi:hypothetical protein
MSNRELFDMLITRTTSCKSITPQRTLTKMLSALELFLENWGWFDDDEYGFDSECPYTDEQLKENEYVCL